MNNTGIFRYRCRKTTSKILTKVFSEGVKTCPNCCNPSTFNRSSAKPSKDGEKELIQERIHSRTPLFYDGPYGPPILRKNTQLLRMNQVSLQKRVTFSQKYKHLPWNSMTFPYTRVLFGKMRLRKNRRNLKTTRTVSRISIEFLELNNMTPFLIQIKQTLDMKLMPKELNSPTKPMACS